MPPSHFSLNNHKRTHLVSIPTFFPPSMFLQVNLAAIGMKVQRMLQVNLAAIGIQVQKQVYHFKFLTIICC
jgi:hypothetical protein